MEVTPQTGRYHQIRRHFNYVSHPVIGDSSHGDTRHNAIYKQHFGLQRLMLAAVRLRFIHPYFGDEIDLNCPVGDSFSHLVNQLMKFSASKNQGLKPND